MDAQEFLDKALEKELKQIDGKVRDEFATLVRHTLPRLQLIMSMKKLDDQARTRIIDDYKAFFQTLSSECEPEERTDTRDPTQ